MAAWAQSLLEGLVAGGACGAVILLRFLARRWVRGLLERERRRESKDLDGDECGLAPARGDSGRE